MNLEILGLIFNFVGSFILILVSLFGVWHRRNEIEKWTKRYWWIGWKPILRIRRPNEKPYWKIKPKYKVVRYGAIPPQHQWNLIGFIYMLIGFLLQLVGY